MFCDSPIPAVMAPHRMQPKATRCVRSILSPSKPPRGDVRACTRARVSVMLPNCEGEALNVAPMYLYAAWQTKA